MKTLFIAVIMLIAIPVTAQFESPLPGSTLIYAGLSYNPYDRESDNIMIDYLPTHEVKMKGTMTLMAGYNTIRNFDKKWGYGINFPLYIFIINEDIHANSNINDIDVNKEKYVGEKFKYGSGLAIELNYMFRTGMYLFTSIEGNYIISNKFYVTPERKLYVDRNQLSVIPSFSLGARYKNIELSWNYLKGVIFKAGYHINKSPF